MAPRQDEEFARSAFARLLTDRGMTNQRWDPGADPPDFDLRVGREYFPVEVAQVMESVAYGGHQRTERGWTRVFETIAQRLETEMTRRNALRGTYAIHLEPAPHAQRLANSLLADVETYLRDTQNLITAPRRVLWRGTQGSEWYIDKIGDRENILGPTMTIGGAKRRFEIQRELHQLMGGELIDKRDKLRDLGNPILLLVDAYSYAEQSDWAEVAAATDFAPFHTVVRAYGNLACQVLVSQDARWPVTP